MYQTSLFSWIFFVLFILFLLFLDLNIFHKGAKRPSIKKALIFSSVWIIISLLFCLWVYWAKGAEMGLKFLAGYLVEKSLSIDNLFVFLLIFSYFHIPDSLRHKVLYWGILGALVLRALFVAGGIVLVSKFEWIIYFFGLFLIYSAWKLAIEKDKKIDLEKSIIIRLVKKIIPITENNPQGRFFVRHHGVLHATPMFLALICVESSDLIFALDSIPAIFGITNDPFIIYTSNIFAILGLRSLYFALAELMDLFCYLHYGLAAILFFIGMKMVLKDYFHPPIAVTLGAILVILALSILASLVFKEEEKTP